jgi:membrane fusion protein (multidrug efflux system)
MPTPHVDVYKVTPQKSIKINDLTYPAETKAYRYATVVAKVNGTLQTIFIKEGSKVKKGETLFKIDDSIYKATLLEAEANLKMAEATLYKAKKDWLRTKRLFERHATSVRHTRKVVSEY